jgi:hypothetical protein
MAQYFGRVSNELTAKQLESIKRRAKPRLKTNLRLAKRDRGRTEILTKLVLLYFTRRRDITPLLQL